MRRLFSSMPSVWLLWFRYLLTKNINKFKLMKKYFNSYTKYSLWYNFKQSLWNQLNCHWNEVDILLTWNIVGVCSTERFICTTAAFFWYFFFLQEVGNPRVHPVCFTNGPVWAVPESYQLKPTPGLAQCPLTRSETLFFNILWFVCGLFLLYKVYGSSGCSRSTSINFV